MSENNNIPNHWQIKALGEVCVFSQGIQVDVSLQSIEKKKDQVRFLRIIDFTQGDDPHRYIDNPGERYYLKKDDIAMVRYGTVGFVCTGKEGVIANNLFKIEPDIRISKKYLIQFLQSELFRRKLETKGATMQALSFGLIKPIQIPIPPLPEQQLIVSRIEELLSDLENGKQQLLTAQQQLNVYRQSLLKWAFEGRLVRTGRDLSQHRDLSQQKDGELPKGWKWVAIEDIATVGTGATPLKGNNKYYEDGKIAWVTSGALNDEFVKVATDFVTELALKETNLSIYPKHTLLLAMYGEGKTRGKCSELLIDASTNQAVAAIHFKHHDERVKPFLKYFLLKNYNDIRRKSSGGVQPNLNLGIVKKTIIPLPPLSEQQLIVSELESKLTVCDKIEETISQSLLQAESLRQSILKKAFEGKLV